MRQTEKRKPSRLFRGLKGLVRLCYRKYEAEGLEYLPDEEAVFVGNHAQLHGPLACELYFPVERYTWCAGQMMHLKDVPAYAFSDFWSQKPVCIRWLFRLASYVIAPLAVYIFNHANTIGVYRDERVLSTFRTTVKRLQEGASVVIFPEHDVPENEILCAFQEGFTDVARLYYKRTGRELLFVPMYIAPALGKLCLGEPIRFRADAPREEERARICRYLTETVTRMARELPEHRVVPYRNVPKKQYPVNRAREGEP